MKKRFIALVLILAMVLSLPAMAIPDKPADRLAELEEIAYYIRNYALKSDGIHPIVSVNSAQLAADPTLFQKTVDAWMAAYGDKFSYFMTEEDYNASFPSSSSYIGIGIQVTQMPAGVYISSVIPGSPAEEKGLLPGDQIVSVDGVDVTDMPYADVTPLIRGTEGSGIDIGYIRPGSVHVYRETLVRRYIPIQNVTYSIEGDIGTISVTQFGYDSDARDFSRIYNEIFPAAGVRSVIIDLRGNPGGLINTLVAMLDAMIREPGLMLFRLVYAHNEVEEYISTGTKDAFRPQKLLILTDEHSASCSEVFVGTLQELGFAEAVGSATYGKARSQWHFALYGGDYLVITASTVELPNIGEYQEVGIIPKHPVPDKLELYPMPDMEALDTSRALFSFAAAGTRWLAVEQRLHELGYFNAVPDNVCDEYTIWCVNRFQAAHNLPLTFYASAAMLRVLQNAVAELALTEGTYADAQMEYAVKLCGK